MLYSKKKESNESKMRRMCRIGCGVERTPGKCDTPGFDCSGFPTVGSSRIKMDQRGFYKVELNRNHKNCGNKLLQSSMLCSQSWRANCDMQLLVYVNDPDYPDPQDISRVTDYIVAYACKGIETYKQERKTIEAMIMSQIEKSFDEQDVVRVARKVLNKSIGEKLISKQECMVQLAGLKLYDCSENMKSISLAR